jgi:cell division protein FtsB
MAATRSALATAPRTRSLRVVDAEAPTRPHLRVVPPHRPTGAIVAVSLVLVFGVLLATAALNTMLVSGQRDLDRIESEIREGEQRNQALRLQVAEMESPEHIRAEAERLGMVEPDEVIWLTPRPDGGSDAMTAPTGGDVRADDGSTAGTGDELADGGPGGSGG